MRALTRKVFKDTTHHKLRSVLTILGIAIGILGLTAINLASGQFKSSFEYSVNTTAQPDIQVFTAPTNASLATTLQHQANVQVVQPEGYINTRWDITSRRLPFRIIGVVDFQHVQVNKFQLVEGNLPGPGQIALEYSDKALEEVQVGQQINVLVNGSYRMVTISGFVRTQGLAAASIVGRGQGYMHEIDVESLFNMSGVNAFMIRLTNPDLGASTARQLSQVLNSQHVLVFAVNVGQDTSVSSLANGIFAVMDGLSLIAILLSICLLLGTIMSLVTEQIRYIGTMKAIGATRGRLIRHYLAIVAIYAITGTLLGLVLGTLGGYELAKYLGTLVGIPIGSLQISAGLVVEGLLVGIGVPLLAALIPTYAGTRITVSQALNSYGVESDGGQGKRGLWTRVTGGVAGRFPQTVLFGMRGLFRKRTRAILTLLTLTVSGAAFLAVQTTSYSFDSFLSQVFTTYHYDVLVSTSDPQPLSKFLQLLQPVAGVGRIEPLSQDTIPTHWGNATLTGVQIDTQLYQKQLVSGRWFTANDQNSVIISQDAAAKSGLKVGDSITLDGALNSATWRIIGIARDYSGVGPGALGTLIAPIGQVDTFFHLPTSYTEFVMVQSTSHAPGAVDDLANRLDNTLSASGLLPDITTAQQQISQNQSTYQIIYTLLDVVALIIALVGAIGLSNTLAMSVLERRREIGILRSMGATSRKVAQVFWTEGLTLGALAWVLAVIIGLPAAYFFVTVQGHLLVPMPFAFSPLSLLYMLVFTLILASLASVGPVFGSTRLKIAQVLRYE